MARVNILTVGVRGVDMKSDPLLLPPGRLHAATNCRFEEGVLRTRPRFIYHDLGISGQFQGACAYAPALGISARSFADHVSGLVVAADGKLWISDTTSGSVACQPQQIPANPLDCMGEVNLFQAENWLIIQNRNSNTMWWGGRGVANVSPGMAPDQYWIDPDPPKVCFTAPIDVAQNAGCDYFPCYVPGGNTTSNAGGPHPETNPGSNSGSSVSGGGGSGGGSSSSPSSSSSTSSSSSSSPSSSSPSSSSPSSSSPSSSASSSASTSGSVSSSSSSSCICSFEVTDVALNSEFEGVFTLNNTGTCTISDVTVTPSGESSYSVDVDPPTIPGGTSATVTVSREDDMRLTNFTVGTPCGDVAEGWPNYP